MVAAFGTPPNADTFCSAVRFPGLKTITPSRLHVPPRLSGASQSVMTGPPMTSILLSFPPAKNPRAELSGDQKGAEARSVPASACAVSVSSERTQRRYLPSGPPATKAIRRPSGETDSGAVDPEVTVPTPAKLHISGSETKKRVVSAFCRARSRYSKAPKASAATSTPTPTNQARRSRLLRWPAKGAVEPGCEPPSAIHFSSSHTSLAACHLFSGSFAKHFFTTRSSTGRVGWREEMGGGSVSRIFAIKLAWLLPSKAFLPVAVSYTT